MSMDEIIPGLWIGDLPSALNVENLKANKIFSIVSAMRGRITINETFIRHQILLDDDADADILVHLLPSIHFIQAELDKGRSVLVHCHAGVSRSATIVAAYVMYSRDLDTEGALELIRSSRPNVEPNEGFLRQLEIFHEAQFKISRRDKTTRMFYMERAVEEVMNGDGSLPDTDMFAKYPRTPSESAPPTPGGQRRRIRCRMCRHELATREHMLDHGQLGPPTPAVRTPADSRRPSTTQISSHHASITHPRPRVGSSNDSSRPRRPSLLSFGAGLSESLSMSTLDGESGDEKQRQSTSSADSSTSSRRASGGESSRKPTLRVLPEIPLGPMDASSSTSALETEDDEEEETSPSLQPNVIGKPPSISAEAAKILHSLGRRLSDAVLATPLESPLEQNDHSKGLLVSTAAGTVIYPPSHFVSPSDLAAQLHSNPKLAALRTPIGPLSPTGKPLMSPVISPPILVDPKCSGYFVEPMKWMEPFLSSGQLAGKIVCPNTKCGAKLGNFDWAGARCGCKEWVTPGFCINRSKVDEIV